MGQEDQHSKVLMFLRMQKKHRENKQTRIDAKIIFIS